MEFIRGLLKSSEISCQSQSEGTEHQREFSFQD